MADCSEEAMAIASAAAAVVDASMAGKRGVVIQTTSWKWLQNYMKCEEP